MAKLLITLFIFLAVGCGSQSNHTDIPKRRSIIKTMLKVNVSKCLDLDPKLKDKGHIKVSITVVNSGVIQKAQVLNSPFKNSPISACLEREIRRQRFSNFTRPQIRFIFPFKNSPPKQHKQGANHF